MVTGINLFPREWEDNKVVKRKEAKLLNTIIDDKLSQINKSLLQLELAGKLSNLTAQEVLTLVREHINPEKAEIKAEEERRKHQEENSFAKYFSAFIDTKKNAGTRRLYLDTYNKVKNFCEDTGISFNALTFDDITPQFINDFQNYCLITQRQNTASRHLRDIRAAMNAAIDDGKTTNDPFRKVRIKREESRDKSYSAKELRKLFDAKCYPGCEQEALDIFKLHFCLIGITVSTLPTCRT